MVAKFLSPRWSSRELLFQKQNITKLQTNKQQQQKQELGKKLEEEKESKAKGLEGKNQTLPIPSRPLWVTSEALFTYLSNASSQENSRSQQAWMNTCVCR